MKAVILLSAGIAMAVASHAAVPEFYDTFDTLYGNGYTFDTASNGWQSSSAAAMVTNSGLMPRGR